MTQTVQTWWFGSDWLLDRAEAMTARFLHSVHVQLNGDRPFDLQVKHRRVHLALAKYVLGFDRFGLGDSFVRGEWSCRDLFGLLCRCCESPVLFNQGFHLVARLMHSAPLLYLNRQSRALSRQQIASHYDTGNDLFQAMLDPTLNYSCGYWARPAELIDFDQFRLDKNPSVDDLMAGESNRRDQSSNQIDMIEQQLQLHRRPEEKDNASPEKIRFSANLHQAQLNKMLMIGRKLKLAEGMTVIDIGCGWGRLAKFLALHFGVHVLAVTISGQQYEFAQQNRHDYCGLCCDRAACDCNPNARLKGKSTQSIHDRSNLSLRFQVASSIDCKTIAI